MATYFKFAALLQQQQWISPAYVGVDEQGCITYLSAAPPPRDVAIETVEGYALPGFQNAHSHAFQYAMAGLAEDHTGCDDFWSWRKAMYDCALSIDPDQAEAIAEMLYTEMVRHGYTHVAEFHYVHHDKTGKPYANPAEMGVSMVAAAKKAGIKITLIPMLYQQGDFDQPPYAEQRRFITPTLDNYFYLLEKSSEATKRYCHAHLGWGVHSLRAVAPDTIVDAVRHAPPELPVHLHVAEQQREVDHCLACTGKRPVQWVLDHVQPDGRFHLVHATHLDEHEIRGIVQSGAHVVLCPSTEANLGDGIFPLKAYTGQGGKWSIGTDSHIGLNPLEEMRLLDYNQRLLTHARNTFPHPAAPYMITTSTLSGRCAMGLPTKDHFALGQPLDAAVFDARSTLLATTSLQHMAATIVFATDVSAMYGTLVNGRWVARGNRSHQYRHAQQAFAKVIAAIKNR